MQKIFYLESIVVYRKSLSIRMQEESINENYEKAASYRDKIKALNSNSKSAKYKSI